MTKFSLCLTDFVNEIGVTGGGDGGGGGGGGEERMNGWMNE